VYDDVTIYKTRNPFRNGPTCVSEHIHGLYIDETASVIKMEEHNKLLYRSYIYQVHQIIRSESHGSL